MKKIILSLLFVVIFQTGIAMDVINLHSGSSILYRNDVTKIDSLVFKNTNAQDTVLVYIGGSVVFKDNAKKIDSMSVNKFSGCHIPTTSEIKIGNQVWATMNATVTTYPDGKPIPEAKSYAEASAYGNQGIGFFMRPSFSADSAAIYGNLYNWDAINGYGGSIAPKGWRIPTKADYDTLIKTLGGTTDLQQKINNTCGFGVNSGTNSSGFSMSTLSVATSDKDVKNTTYNNVVSYSITICIFSSKGTSAGGCDYTCRPKYPIRFIKN